MSDKQQKKQRKQKPVLEAVSNTGDSKFARALGSVDYHTREAGLQALATWLSRRHDIAELELLRLWKGVFYCFWHSDKASVQTALAERLSEIMTQLPEEVGWRYYQTFVRTMRREWAGIDRLRLDKFMMLIRKFFAQLLRTLQAHSWHTKRVQRVGDYWLQEVLLPGDTLVAAGVAYHLTDLLLTELGRVVEEGGEAPSDATLRLLLDPFCQALAGTSDPALIYRLRQGVFDPLVSEVRQAGEADALRHLDAPTFAAHLFQLGARPETRARNREALYAVSSALENAAAKRQRRREQEPEQQQGAAAAKKSKQQKQEQRQAVANGAMNGVQDGAAAAAAGQQQAEPASSKKSKKRRQSGVDGSAATPIPAQQQQQQQGPATAQVQVQAADASPAAAAAVPPSSSKKQKKKSRLGPAEAVQLQAAARQQRDAAAAAQQQSEQQQEQAQRQPDIPEREQQLLAVAVAAVAGTPGASSTPGTQKKNVRFSLKRNLVNVIGQPPKPADVRTPPTAKPKGSALKKASSFGGGGPASAPERLLTRAGAGRAAQVQAYMNGKQAAPGNSAAAAGAPGSSKKQKRRASLPAPGSFSRPRASEFF